MISLAKLKETDYSIIFLYILQNNKHKQEGGMKITHRAIINVTLLENVIIPT